MTWARVVGSLIVRPEAADRASERRMLDAVIAAIPTTTVRASSMPTG